MYLVGIDLAWGEKSPDGLCLIEADAAGAQLVDSRLSQGDDALLDYLAERVGRKAALLTIDAPLVIKNRTGTRPVDRLTHRLFHRQHAACHPANLNKCPRPARLACLLEEQGYTIGWDLRHRRRVAAEVYPHPAMCRMFGLDRIIKYKKGPVAERRPEFARLQACLHRLRRREFAEFDLGRAGQALLRQPWSKPIEDQTDALFCALIGYWHWRHQGKRSEVIGDLETGFILLPAAPC